MTKEYKMAYTEVLEIIKHLSPSEIKKIPKETIDFFERNQDSNYNFTYDVNESLEGQNVLRETNIIILKLFNEFFMSNEQNTKFKHILNCNEDAYQREQENKYNPDNIFKDRISSEDKTKPQGTAIIEINNEQNGIWKKILNKIKKVFGK